MRPDDLDPVEANLLDGIAAAAPAVAGGSGAKVDGFLLATLFEAQVTSRLLDHTARWLRTRGIGYYTIGSAGHESNGAVALALRPTDPALLHYRSGAFYVARAAQVADQDPVADVLRGMFAATTDQISGGRHKVFGNEALNIVPQTSTIASHLPRAVGLAASFGHADGRTTYERDAVVVCSFGDASLNHSTAQGALNWAAYLAHRGAPCPVLFLCEDNGIGISVPSPAEWVSASTSRRHGLEWDSVDGQDPSRVATVTRDLAERMRSTGRPAFLHLRTVRYLGHAGTDVESAYRSAAEVRADLARDPIIGTARQLIADGHDPTELTSWYLDRRHDIRQRAVELANEPQFRSAAEVMAPLRRPRAEPVAKYAAMLAQPDPAPLTLAQTINRTLAVALERRPEMLVFGEDVGAKGGVYGVTRGLQKMFDGRRVFDTILDEQSILGFALGAGLNGFLPVPEIQYLAYLHNAEDQLRGEAATLRFFSNGQYTNPMVLRVAGYGYQKGFGGHFHNDDSVAVLTDIPGIVVASPAHPADAGPMLRSCLAAAHTDGAVCVFLEPIALYHTTDLHLAGDGGWLAPLNDEHVAIGSAREHGEGTDLTIITWGNGLFLSLRALARLRDRHDLAARVLDLRWLAPLPIDDIMSAALATGRVLVVDETRRTGGMGALVVSALVETGFRGPIERVASKDSFVPLGAAANLVLVSEDDIVESAIALATRRRAAPGA